MIEYSLGGDSLTFKGLQELVTESIVQIGIITSSDQPLNLRSSSSGRETAIPPPLWSRIQVWGHHIEYLMDVKSQRTRGGRWQGMHAEARLSSSSNSHGPKAFLVAITTRATDDGKTSIHSSSANCAESR